MPVYRIKDWDSFQHYKDRSPPWIRLHRSLLDNYEYHCLPDASKALAPFLWLLASENRDPSSGTIDAPDEKIAFRLHMQVKAFRDAIKPLIHSGFVTTETNASISLASSEPNATPETEVDSTEVEVETEKVDKPPAVDYGTMTAIWNNTAGEVCPKVEKLTDARKRCLKSRMADSFDGSVDKWRAYCEKVRSIGFLTGSNDRGWVADFDWCIKQENLIKVMEGKYANNRTGNGTGGSAGIHHGAAQDAGSTYQPPSKWQTAAARVLDKIDRGEI